MQKFLIQYSMKPEFADENATLLRAYLEELELVRPANMAYAVNRLGDGTSFFHLVESTNGATPFAHLPNYRLRANWAAGKYQNEPALIEFTNIEAYKNV